MYKSRDELDTAVNIEILAELQKQNEPAPVEMTKRERKKLAMAKFMQSGIRQNEASKQLEELKSLYGK